MAKAIFIAHPSKLIRMGLTRLVEQEMVVKVFEGDDLGLLKESHFSTFSKIVLVVSHLEKTETIFGLQARKTNQFYTVAIDCLTPSVQLPVSDYVFSLNGDTLELLQKLKSFLIEDNSDNPDDELSSREREVLRLIALGHTNKSIADTLFISTHTVISHRKNITEKLGIKSIPGLTVYAIMQKIVSQSQVSNDSLQ